MPHHGSSTSSTEKFIDYINPKIAVITVGERNRFNHPNNEVLDRYIDRKIKIYRTDIDGNIEMIMSKNKINIKTYNDSHNIKYTDIIYCFFYTLMLVEYFINKKSEIILN